MEWIAGLCGVGSLACAATGRWSIAPCGGADGECREPFRCCFSIVQWLPCIFCALNRVAGQQGQKRWHATWSAAHPHSGAPHSILEQYCSGPLHVSHCQFAGKLPAAVLCHKLVHALLCCAVLCNLYTSGAWIMAWRLKRCGPFKSFLYLLTHSMGGYKQSCTLWH